MTDKSFNLTFIEEGLGAASIAACIVASPLIRSWYSKWGASAEELKMPLPGDERVPNPSLESTRAITIQAPAADIWPWLVQMGQGRGGLYSYERLENLIGCDIHNADRILPEHQNLKVGDKVLLHSGGYPAFEVAAIEPNQALILMGDESGEQAPPAVWVWIFYLNPIDEDTTRLILRTRLDYEPNLGNVVIWRGFTDPISFNMERKMLQGIKARVEAAASG
jgi:hypothetical protein